MILHFLKKCLRYIYEWLNFTEAFLKEYTTFTYIIVLLIVSTLFLCHVQIGTFCYPFILSINSILWWHLFVDTQIGKEFICLLDSIFIGIYNTLFGKEIIYSFVEWFKGIYTWSLPISLTFYYFIAREQKTLSESSLNLDRKGLRHFFYTATIIIAGGYILGNLDQSLKERYLPLTKVFLVSCIIFSVSSIKFIQHLFQSININYLFLRVLERTSFSLNALLLNKNRCAFFRRKLYINLIYLMESIYQMLNQSLGKGLIKVYSANYGSLQKVLSPVFKIERKDIELISKDGSSYADLYKLILDNQIALITILYSNNRISEGYNALLNLFLLVPDGDITITSNSKSTAKNEYDALMNVYLCALCGLGLFFYKANVILYPLILQIKELPIQRIGIDNIISVYRTWIIRAIESCDVKMLVCLSYALMETIEEASPQIISENKISTNEIVTIDQMENLMSKVLNIHFQLTDSDKSIGRCIYILLNAAIKSLEMSQYQCVGFVVKFIASNFDSKITNSSFEQFQKNKGRDNKFDNSEIGSYFGIKSFNLNNKTDQYCLEKLSFLLYGQQVYIKTNKIAIKHIPEEYINFKECVSNNFKYVYDKIIAGKDKYGLIWLNDEKFHKRLFYSIIENRQY